MLSRGVRRTCIDLRRTETLSAFYPVRNINRSSRDLHSTMALRKASHQFAPLAASRGAHADDAIGLKGIIFDMDGTLTKPQNYIFVEMRNAVGIPASSDILDHIHALSPTEQEEAMEKIREIERKAMVEQESQPGLGELLEYLDSHQIPKAICTRNFDAPVKHFVTTHVPRHIKALEPIVTREFTPPKPSPAGLLHIAHSWGVTEHASIPETPALDRPLPLIMVGDSIDDMTAGREAGALTVLLRSEGKEDLEKMDCTDVVIDRLNELVHLLDGGLKATP